jgi:hypothetical protein
MAKKKTEVSSEAIRIASEYFNTNGVDSEASPINLISIGVQLCIDLKQSVMDRKIRIEMLKNDFPDNIGEELDPGNELDWYSITVGWAIAHGMKPDEALEFSSYIRYNTNLM